MTRKSGRPRLRRAKLGALTLLGSLLLASAVLRLGSDAAVLLAGRAFAETIEEDANEPTDAQDAASGPQDANALIAALAQREERVEKREREVLLRAQALRVAEQEIDEKMVALEAAEASLKETLSQARVAAETDLEQLTQVYAQMKPRQAAALFEQMAPDFAAGFLGRMQPQAAAAIMAGLSPEAAYTISVMLAGRNADVPKE